MMMLLLRTLLSACTALGMVGPADSEAIPRPKQVIVPVGLVPHPPPTAGETAEVTPESGADRPAPEPEPEVDVTVVYMPPKKKLLGVNAPRAPLSCEGIACRRMKIVGGIAVGAAAGLISTGVVFVAQPGRIIEPPRELSTGRAIGWTILSAGLGLGIAGGLLLFSALRDLKKHRASSSNSRLTRGTLHF